MLSRIKTTTKAQNRWHSTYSLKSWLYGFTILLPWRFCLFPRKVDCVWRSLVFIYFILNDLKINLTVYFVHYCGLPCHSSKSSAKIKLCKHLYKLRVGSMPPTHWSPALSPWRVKLSGVRQSKIIWRYYYYYYLIFIKKTTIALQHR
jgi:hypothetical protein